EHEQWARGVEAYFMEGRAPSSALARIFETFKRWLLDIYRSVRALDVTLTDDIRAVMDRMLTAEESIIEKLAELPPQAQADAMRASVAALVEGHPVKAGELIEAGAEQDPRIAEAMHGPQPASESPARKPRGRRVADPQ